MATGVQITLIIAATIVALCIIAGFALNLKSSVKNATTKELVDELVEREGVKYKKVDPYVDEVISANGPAILIKVID